MIRLDYRQIKLPQQWARTVRVASPPNIAATRKMTEYSACTAGKIALPSALLQFWDLGGQRGIRSIWPKYYGDCHAVVYVVDAVDHERLSEGWEVFGNVSLS